MDRIEARPKRECVGHCVMPSQAPGEQDCLPSGLCRTVAIFIGQYANLAAQPMMPIAGYFVPGNLGIRGDSQLPEKLYAPMTNEDLRELEHIDPFRAWRSEKKFVKDHCS